MSPTLQHVPLADIALDDRTFVVTYRPEMQALQRSVARVGVLTPLHLRRPSEPGLLQVVCGSKRLHACQQSGQAQVPALVYPAADLSEHEAFLLALHDNLGCRVFNAVEKARLLRRLQAHFGYDEQTLIEEYCPLLDLPPRPDTLEAYCTLATLEESLQAAVVEGTLPLETAGWIGHYADEDRQALVTLFTGVKFGGNRARELSSTIDDICLRDACSATELLQQLAIPTVLTDPQRSGPQKIETIRNVLRQARYPQLSAYEQRFQDAVRRLHLPPQITLRPPPYFEGQHYQITLRFSQRQELQQALQRLLDAATGEGLDDLLALL